MTITSEPTGPTAYLNARIYSVDSNGSWYQAMLVEHGRIVKLGSDEDVRNAADRQTKIVDLEGRMVMPGLHDAHTHLLLAGLRFRNESRLGINPTPDEILTSLSERGKLSNWIVAGEYNPFAFPNAAPDRAFLDEAYPDTPVFLYDMTLHHGLANARALELAGITSESVDPQGGRIMRRPGSNDPTGELVETAKRKVQRLLPQYAPDVCLDAMRWSLEMCSRYGITSVQEAGATLAELQVLNQLDQAGEMTANIATHIIWKEEGVSAASDEDMEALIDAHNRYASPHIRTHFVKCWMDGAPLPPHFTASLLDPVTGQPDDKLIITEDELAEGLARFDKRKISVKIHCAADGSVRAALNAVERVRKQNGFYGPRHDVAHALFVSPSDLPRFAALNVSAEMSPAVWHYRAPEFAVLDAGCKFATLERNGAAVTIGSDWALTETPNLFPALQGMLDRGEESVSIASALKMMTIAGAQAVGIDERTGSLEEGKSADFIVLDRNLFDIPVDQVGETSVLMTVFEGRVVYQQ